MSIIVASRFALATVVLLCGSALVALALHDDATDGEAALRDVAVLSEEFVDELRDLSFAHTHAISRSVLGPEMRLALDTELEAMTRREKALAVRLDELAAQGAGDGVVRPLGDALKAWTTLKD